MFSVFRGNNLIPINANAKDSEIKTWKSDEVVKTCYKKLFKKVSPEEPETYMSRIIRYIWKGDRSKRPKVQIAFAISTCETILNPANSSITISEEVIKPILEKNLVSFLNS
jgi:hypothetical protein